MVEIIHKSLKEAQNILSKYILKEDTVSSIAEAALILSEAIAGGKKVIACGNGGSLCDATHFAEELTGRFRKNRKPLSAIAINDPAHISCVGNDFGFDYIFSRYVETFGQEGDVLLVFSTSGNSENIIKAARQARFNKLKVIGFTRQIRNQLQELSDVCIAIPHDGYSDRIQEMHIMTVHILIECLEAKLNLNAE